MSTLPVRLIVLGPEAWWRTQTVYHAIAETMSKAAPDTIVLTWPRRPYLCLGYHQAYDAVLDRATCARRGLPVIRRHIGGGTTYLDAQQLFYQCIFHHTRVPLSTRAIYARLLAAPVATLRHLGLDARLRDVNEVEANGRRIAGTGGGRLGEACIVVGNILFDFDYETMTEVWRVPWPSFRDLAAQALQERVTTLRQLVGAISKEEVISLLVDAFSRTLGRPIRVGELTPEEVERAEALYHPLTAPDFLNLHQEEGPAPPMRVLKIAAGVYIHAVETEVDGYKVQGSLREEEGSITAARLTSHPPRPWTEVEQRMRGLSRTSWETALSPMLASVR